MNIKYFIFVPVLTILSMSATHHEETLHTLTTLKPNQSIRLCVHKSMISHAPQPNHLVLNIQGQNVLVSYKQPTIKAHTPPTNR